jgi:transcriptional regulator with XRE-family HTH domain
VDDIQKLFARNLRLARQRAGLSQEGLAHAAGLDRTYVSGIEREMRNPTLTVVAKLASAVGVRAHELLAPNDLQLPSAKVDEGK